jgi:hypothetical protein
MPLPTRLWNVESQKKEKGELDFLSIDQVREQVLSAYAQAPCISTIYKDLQEGRIGESPKKRSGSSKISDSDWSNVCAAFVSLVQINQLNRNDGKNSQKKLGAKIAAVFGNRYSQQHLIERCLKDTAINLLASKGNMQEHRRILWNTHKNLVVWFDTWEQGNLVELGFAHLEEDTKTLKIPDDLGPDSCSWTVHLSR